MNKDVDEHIDNFIKEKHNMLMKEEIKILKTRPNLIGMFVEYVLDND